MTADFGLFHDYIESLSVGLNFLISLLNLNDRHN